MVEVEINTGVWDRIAPGSAEGALRVISRSVKSPLLRYAGEDGMHSRAVMDIKVQR